MRLYVLLQGSLTSQFHSALLAHILLTVLLNVAVEILLRLQFLLTHGTLELAVLDSVLVVLVEVQRHFVG